MSIREFIMPLMQPGILGGKSRLRWEPSKGYGLMSAATSLRLKIGGDTEFLPFSCVL